MKGALLGSEVICVTCPKCRADIGEQCRTAKGGRTHTARQDKAARARRRGFGVTASVSRTEPGIEP